MTANRKTLWIEVTPEEMARIMEDREAIAANRHATAVTRRWDKALAGLERALDAFTSAVESTHTACDVASADDGNGLYCFSGGTERTEEVELLKRKWADLCRVWLVLDQLPVDHLEQANKGLVDVISRHRSVAAKGVMP